MANYRRDEQFIPLRPFQDWIEKRIEELEKTIQDQQGNVGNGAERRLAAELGFGFGESPVKRLYRIRIGVREVTTGGKRRLVKTDTWRRSFVEDALWSAGLKLEDVYGAEYADPDVDLEPAANCWSRKCQGELVHPVGGECLWCGSRVAGADTRLETAA